MALGGRDRMLPLVGEGDVEQLRERVQGLEAAPSAATFDDAGEPVLEFDETAPMPPRAPWVQSSGDVPVRVGIAKVTADMGGGMYTISEAWSTTGAPTLKTNGFTDKTAYALGQGEWPWEVDDYVFYVQIQKAAGGSEYYIERDGSSAAGVNYCPGQCGDVVDYYDDDGRCIGWYTRYEGGAWLWRPLRNAAAPATPVLE